MWFRDGWKSAKDHLLPLGEGTNKNRNLSNGGTRIMGRAYFREGGEEGLFGSRRAAGRKQGFHFPRGRRAKGPGRARRPAAIKTHVRRGGTGGGARDNAKLMRTAGPPRVYVCNKNKQESLQGGEGGVRMYLAGGERVVCIYTYVRMYMCVARRRRLTRGGRGMAEQKTNTRVSCKRALPPPKWALLDKTLPPSPLRGSPGSYPPASLSCNSCYIVARITGRRRRREGIQEEATRGSSKHPLSPGEIVSRLEFLTRK